MPNSETGDRQSNHKFLDFGFELQDSSNFEISIGANMNRFLRFVFLVAAFAIGLIPLIVIGQAKVWSPPKTPWGDPDIQGLWPGADMVGTRLERERRLGTLDVLPGEDFEKRVRVDEWPNESDAAPTSPP